ncbi:MAG: periplasmic nitrate reductase, NapE protein [Rhodospirillales bacterium]
MTAEPTTMPPPDRKRETYVFLVTCFVIIPGLAVAFTGAYGLAIWLSQLFLGPPGPPG